MAFFSRERHGYNPAGDDNPKWKFVQVFGERPDSESVVEVADIISAGEFCHTGDFLATGDRGGRVVIFKKAQSGASYNFYSEFQSHQSEFDYLKSMEIEERISQISWLRRKHVSHFLLSTNDRTIKLWKIYERQSTVESGLNGQTRIRDARDLRVPRCCMGEPRTDARVKKVFANGHSYNINSISVCRDDETFLSADDLRINLWNQEVSDQSFNVVDLKPANMEQLNEVITTARYHPEHSQLFMYSSSKGNTRLCDTRAAALCDKHTKVYGESKASSRLPCFFDDMTSSITDAKFSHDGRFFATRDFMTVKVWDTLMEKRPLEMHEVHEHLRPQLTTLYESDALFDRFEVHFSHNSEELITGTYNNQFRVFDRTTKRSTLFEASQSAIDGEDNSLRPIQLVHGPPTEYHPPAVRFTQENDFNLKTLQAMWHPHEPLLAIAAVNNLYVYAQ